MRNKHIWGKSCCKLLTMYFGASHSKPPSFSALLCTLGCCCCHRCCHVGCCDDGKGDLCIILMCTIQYSWPVRVLTTRLVGRDTLIPDLGFELLALTLILLVTEGILWTKTFPQALPLYPPWLPKAYVCRQQLETNVPFKYISGPALLTSVLGISGCNAPWSDPFVLCACLSLYLLLPQ